MFLKVEVKFIYLCAGFHFQFVITVIESDF